MKKKIPFKVTKQQAQIVTLGFVGLALMVKFLGDVGIYLMMILVGFVIGWKGAEYQEKNKHKKSAWEEFQKEWEAKKHAT